MKSRNQLRLLSFTCGLGLLASLVSPSNASGLLVEDTTISYTVSAAGPVTAGVPDFPKYTRTIDLRVKRPDSTHTFEKRETYPIVVYSHGNSNGLDNGHSETENQYWTDALAENKYITINIGHAPIETQTQLITACFKVGVDYLTSGTVVGFGHPTPPAFSGLTVDTTLHTNSDCTFLNALQYIRFRDVYAVLHQVHKIKRQINKNYALSGNKDASMLDNWNGKFVLMGHSAGTISVMSFAGATRTFLLDTPDSTHVIADPTQFDAYIALSPQSNKKAEPYMNGYAPDAWVNVDQPILMITGVDDSTGQDTDFPQDAKQRKIPYGQMLPGAVENKYFLWFTGAAAGHSEMNLSGNPRSSAFVDQSTAAKAAVFKFLDIHTRNNIHTLNTSSVLDASVISDSTLSTTKASYLDFDLEAK